MKSWLKTQHQKTKIITFASITSWQIEGNKVEVVADFIILGSQITADSGCSYKTKRKAFFFFLGRKAVTNLDSTLKRRDITLPTKVKAMVFPIVMYGRQSCIIKKAECQRTDAFELWCWRRLLIIPWTARRSNQSILNEIRPEYSLKEWCWSRNSNTLTTWWEELTHWKRPWCWERLKAKGEEGGRGWRLDSFNNSMSVTLSKLQEALEDRRTWLVAVHEIWTIWR